MARNENNYKGLIDNEVIILNGGQAVILFEGHREDRCTTIGVYNVGDKDYKIAYWGKENNLPAERELLISANNIVPQLIATKRNIILGSGLMAYKEIFESGKRKIERVEMPTQIDDWLLENEIQTEYLPTSAKNLIIHVQTYTEGVRKGKGVIHKIKAHECLYVRAKEQDKSGKIPGYFLKSYWGKQTAKTKQEETPAIYIPAYDKSIDQPKFMISCADKLLGGPYYYTPHWEGATEWIKTANCIPSFHLSNLQNGYNIRYLIRVPEDYFKRTLSETKRNSEKKAEFEVEAKKDFTDKLNKFFQGAQNSGKAMITMKYLANHLQKEFSGIEIIPIDVNLQDEAMLKLFDSSNAANTSSHGTPPALAGIATGAKMTSGSEIRNLYNFYQLTVAPTPRQILLKPIEIAIKSFFKDTSIKLGFIDTELVATDENQHGKENVTTV